MALVMYGVSNQYDIPLLYLKLRIYAQFQIISPPLLTGERRSIGFKGTMTSCAHRSRIMLVTEYTGFVRLESLLFAQSSVARYFPFSCTWL